MSNHVVRSSGRFGDCGLGSDFLLPFPGPGAGVLGTPESAVLLVTFLAAPSRRFSVSPPATAVNPTHCARARPGSAQPTWFPWRPGLRRVPLPRAV